MSIINKVEVKTTPINFNYQPPVQTNNKEISQINTILNNNFNEETLDLNANSNSEYEIKYKKINTVEDRYVNLRDTKNPEKIIGYIGKNEVVEVISQPLQIDGKTYWQVKLKAGGMALIGDGTHIIDATEEEIEEYNSHNLKVKTVDSFDDIASEKIKQAVLDNQDDLKNAGIITVTDNTFMTVNNKYINDSFYTITHVIIEDPSQMINIQSFDQYGTGGETISSMAYRTEDLVAAFTGSFFISNGIHNIHAVDQNGNPAHGDNHVVIIDEELVDTDTVGLVNDSNREEALNTVAGTQIICLDKDGNLFYAPEGATAKQLIEEYNVTNTFVSHETPRLSDGKLLHATEIQTEDGITYNFEDNYEWDYDYNRTYICMKEPGEYYFIQGFGTPANAMVYAKDELNCKFAGSLEQGGAVALMTGDITVMDHVKYEGIGNAVAFVDNPR